jgi:hypothetical protein
MLARMPAPVLGRRSFEGSVDEFSWSSVQSGQSKKRSLKGTGMSMGDIRVVDGSVLRPRKAGVISVTIITLHKGAIARVEGDRVT